DDLYHSLLNNAPVYRIPNTEVYFVSSWKLIHEVLKNAQDYSANLTGILIRGESGEPELFDLAQFGASVDAIANADEPTHSIHRKLLLPQLNSRTVAAMETEIRGWVQHRVTTLVDKQGGDCIATLANEIPVMVMAKLMGLPVDDTPRLLNWAFSGGDILAGTTTLQRLLELGSATAEMMDYLRQHFDAVLALGRYEQAENIMQELANGVQQSLISEQEAISIMVVLVGAAGESTSSLVGSAIRLLAEDEQLQQKLRQHPELIDPYIEEVVRLESPFKGHYRAVINPTKLDGITLPSNARVYLLWAAANRDPAIFDSPTEIQLDRARPTEHLGFGYGIHFCIGARLARLETRIILEELLGSCGSFQQNDELPHRHVASIFVRRLDELHLIIS
ncbi:MAG: cytochrome P450, partial [Spongiibacteraceae bacterium]